MELNCLLLQSWRDSQLLSPPAKKNNKKKKKTKKRGEEINSSLKEFVRLHQKVLNICFGTAAGPLRPWERWPSPDKSHVCPLRKKVLLLSWLIDGWWLTRQANQCQDVCLCEHWQDDWIYSIRLYVNVFYILIQQWSFERHSYRPLNDSGGQCGPHYSEFFFFFFAWCWKCPVILELRLRKWQPCCLL